jgi:hypothetical protein
LSLRPTTSTPRDTRFARLEFGTFYEAVFKSTVYEPIILVFLSCGRDAGATPAY